ncbi:MAG: geranylgeranyl reductase family protein [Candidatus Aenigmarchaeota archaeon]|nr:geranylgeranyl reductase family protein [Candidatus Aenigmarchaeota archaeon]
MQDYEVIVVGGGPAGSSCATFLGRKGVKTLLVDKASFPRDKTCGDGITGKSYGVLEELGVEDEIIKNQHMETFGLVTSSPSGVSLNTRSEREADKKKVYVCKRQIFDNILFQEAKKKADIIENFSVGDLIIENGAVAGIKGAGKDGKEKEFRAKIVVGADGANSIVARKLGLNDFQTDRSLVAVRTYYENVGETQDLIEFHFLEDLTPGYFWIFPAGDNVSNVGIAVVAGDVPKRKLNLKNKLEEIVKNSRFAPRFTNAKQISEVKGWNLPTGAQKRKRAGDGFILVGDAASLIDPFTGEGIGNALVSGKMAAEVIADSLGSNDFSYNVLKRYESMIDERMGKEFKTSYKFQKFGRNAIMFSALVEELNSDKKSMKIAASSFGDDSTATANLKIPLSLYVKVLIRYIKSYIKMKMRNR